MRLKPIKTAAFVLYSIAAAISWGCGSQSNSKAEAIQTWEDSSKQGGDDTSVVTDSSPLPDDTETQDGSCFGLGESCTTSAVCCSGSCELGSDGKYACTAKSRCQGIGDPCEVAADCCSLGCDGQKCVESLCATSGEKCESPAQCCSNRCEGGFCRSGGACLPAGEDCSGGGASACCSGTCQKASDGVERCVSGGRCRSEGEVCAKDGDCCNHQCDNGFCLVLKECDVAGEACDNGKDCCSGVCADDGSGYHSCVFLGGCRPYGELCRKDADCCNNPASADPGVCNLITETIGRCENPQGCAPAGELCGAGYHDCCPCAIPQSSPGCPNEKGDLFCQETIFGVSRCFSDDCVVEGGSCKDDTDCCGGVCTGGACDPGLACRADLEPCAMPDQCCCGICAPDQAGLLVCCPGGSCIPEEQPCTTDADCCEGNCSRAGICEPSVDECIPTGAPCENDEDCCSGNCSEQTGTCQGILI